MKAKVGQWAMHRGTKDWGEVLKVVKQPDGTTENFVRKHPDHKGITSNESWWASYHIASVRNTMPPKAWGWQSEDE
jgi:hypothetical protein